ncbi:hypothetical protein T08_16449 [Trichinella sp. T8]|nr:hypothetical protein T08_16449 [Trichinella sp. T8]
MYRLAEVEVAALYPRIREVTPNCRYQGCLKITDNGIWIICDRRICWIFLQNHTYWYLD